MGLAQAKLLIEAPVNGGRNYNGPKVKDDSLALVKPSYMRETPRKLFGTRRLLAGSKNPRGMGTIRREGLVVPGTLRDFTLGSSQ